MRLILFVSLLLFLPPIFGWQDDVEVNLRNPFGQFTKEPGFGFFKGAHAEIRAGRYLVGSENQRWRGGTEGDVAFLNFGDKWVWHMGLNMETLVDDKNDINFRLVQVYYQALTGAKLRLGPGMLHTGFRHRCSHGTDRATESRITIRSGLTASYQWIIKAKEIQFDIKPGFNFYILGQNSDFTTQPRGGAFLTANAVWPISGPVFMAVGIGTNAEMVSQGHNFFYLVSDEFSDWHFEPLWAGRLAIRIDQGLVKSDFGFHFSQNLDNGIGAKAQKTSALSFDINFMW